MRCTINWRICFCMVLIPKNVSKSFVDCAIFCNFDRSLAHPSPSAVRLSSWSGNGLRDGAGVGMPDRLLAARVDFAIN